MREALVQIQHKMDVVQKLIACADNRRRVPALWTAWLDESQSHVLVRMLSDVSGTCFHLPIEIPVAPLSDQHREWLQDGVTAVLATVPSEHLSIDVAKNAVAMAVVYMYLHRPKDSKSNSSLLTLFSL